MKQTLKEFILDWNKSHRHFTFSANNSPITGRPLNIEIRYSAAKYQNFFCTNSWNKLKDVVEAKSHGTMYVVTDEHLFERGIVEIMVASSNHNYQERFIVGVLRWIGEDFFPKEYQSR